MEIRVYDDDEEWFRSIFANSKKEEAIQNQYEFFVQRMGGPPLYSQRKGKNFLLDMGFEFNCFPHIENVLVFHMVLLLQAAVRYVC